jgi:hypothetical protein
MLISTLRDEIITEIGGDTSDTAFATKILQFMNSALRRFPLWTRSRFMFTTKNGTLTSGQYSLTLPSGMVHERDVYYISEGNRMRIDKAPSNDYFNEAFNSSALGKPNLYRIIGQTVEFDRTADATYTIYFECVQEKDAVLAADTWTSDTSVAEVLKDGAKYYYYRYVEDDAAAGDFLSLFKNGLDELDYKYMSTELGSHIDEE